MKLQCMVDYIIELLGSNTAKTKLMLFTCEISKRFQTFRNLARHSVQN